MSVEQQTAKLGDRAELGAKIYVDGRIISTMRQQPKIRVLLYHKPAGEICTHSDEEGRPTVFAHLPELRQGKWISIGRLDFNTSGLLMITNSGDLAHRFMHPSADIEREYAVRILGSLTPEMRQALLTGIKLEDGMAHCEIVEEIGGIGANRWYRVVVKEGRNRLVRRLFAHFNLTVNRLMRTRFGAIVLPPHLKQGKCKELTEEEIQLHFK